MLIQNTNQLQYALEGNDFAFGPNHIALPGRALAGKHMQQEGGGRAMELVTSSWLMPLFSVSEA